MQSLEEDIQRVAQEFRGRTPEASGTLDDALADLQQMQGTLETRTLVLGFGGGSLDGFGGHGSLFHHDVLGRADVDAVGGQLGLDAVQHRAADQFAIGVDGADRIVVTGNREVDVIRVGVAVANRSYNFV